MKRHAEPIALLLLAPASGLLAVALLLAPGLDRNPATLPQRLSLCGRDWQQGASSVTLAEAEVHDRVKPIVADPGLFADCPSGACTDVAAAGPCSVVIYVRVGPDSYVGYALVGGP
jgi:hypothetical protein